MGLYIFQHPKTGKIKEVFQNMNDEHVYEENGVKWERVWTVPQAAVDANIDPFNQNAFVDKLGNTKGDMGSAWDRSREMSEKRAAKRDGVDPVREKYFEDYKTKRKGTEHPTQIKERISKLKVEI